MKCFESTEGNVWKYVFDFKDAIAESVLYRYKSFYNRTVLCCSVQSGCPVGCTFCGTGKQFIRNLTSGEIVKQISDVFEDKSIIANRVHKLQIMFMSMGEPMLNIDNVLNAIVKLNKKYPNAELLVSTMAPKKPDSFNRFINLSQVIDKIGLQFSIHEAFDKDRDELIPYKNKYTLREIRDLGMTWSGVTGRKVYLNYCVDSYNTGTEYIYRLKDLFSPNVFNFTFSVICNADETLKDAYVSNKKVIQDVTQTFLTEGYNVRMFDPAGQDDIGGGCGQLWYTQKWIDEFKNKPDWKDIIRRFKDSK